LIVTVVNQKGGVGKTTVTLGLADAAARSGRRVLVVDLDPQANATTGLAVWDPPSTVDRALELERPGILAQVVVRSGWPAAPGGTVPDVAASSPSLAGREPLLATDPIGAQDRLRVALEGDDHDLVLVDCPPSLGLLTVNGLFAADRALVVTEPAAWASDGVDQVVRTIARVGDRRGRPLPLAGIVVNRLGRTRDARYWQRQLTDVHGEAVLGPVALRAAVAEAAAQSLPLHALGPRPGAAEAIADFDDLLAAVLDLPRRPRAQADAGSDDGHRAQLVLTEAPDDEVDAAPTDQPAPAGASAPPAGSSPFASAYGVVPAAHALPEGLAG
jgi:chromosome partitioning protein